MSEFVGQHGTF